MLKNLVITLIASLGLFVTTSFAQNVPERMPYQGFLHDADGQGVNGNVSVSFKLYEELLSNTPIWQETINNVAVSYGAFSVNLGETAPNLKDYVYTGRAQYVGISINGGPELSPRSKLGTLPYAFLSYNAQKLDGRSAADFVTTEQLETELETFTNNFQGGGGLTIDEVNTLIDNRGYLDTNAINALINNRGYLDTNAVNTLIDNRGYLDTNAVNTLIDNRGYLDTNAVNTLIDNRGYLDTNAINALIDNRNYLDANAVNALIDNRNYLDANAVNALIDNRNYLDANAVNALIDNRITDLNNTISDLTDRLDALEANGIASTDFILGVSNHADSGMFEFGGDRGIRAAGKACQATFANEPTAHFCSLGEVQAALSLGNVNANVNNIETWLYPTYSKNDGGFAGDADFCQSLLYNSGDAATGTSVRILLNSTSTRGATGSRLAYNDARGCGTELKVLCCR